MVSFNVYNPNLNLFTQIIMITEFPASGNIVPFHSYVFLFYYFIYILRIQTIKAILYNNDADWVILAVEMIVITYFLYGFVFTEIWEVSKCFMN
jgi:hypothetical protein